MCYYYKYTKLNYPKHFPRSYTVVINLFEMYSRSYTLMTSLFQVETTVTFVAVVGMETEGQTHTGQKTSQCLMEEEILVEVPLVSVLVLTNYCCVRLMSIH